MNQMKQKKINKNKFFNPRQNMKEKIIFADFFRTASNLTTWEKSGVLVCVNMYMGLYFRAVHKREWGGDISKR